jgi:alpha-1,3-rhamnosyl/mannosyltransferase
MLGFVDQDQLVALYQTAAAFLYPTLYEGFGFPLLEANSSGTPVVCSDAGSLKEIINDSAYVVDPYDVDSIAAGLSAVISNAALRDKLVSKGFANANRFSWRETAHRSLLTYCVALTESSRPE